MPKTSYPGTKIYSSNNYYETKVSFSTIYNNPKIKNIEKPNYQGALNIDKVDKMIQEYQQNPLFIRPKNKITIGIFCDTFYIIDGQHRIEMVNRLYELNNNIDDNLIFCWFKFNNDEDMMNLFNSLNKDSTKNKFYIKQSKLNQININSFVKLLKERLNIYFSKKKSTNGKIKTIEELRDDLIKIDFFSSDARPEELYQFIIKKNNDFYNENRYQINIEKNPDTFYKDEQRHINDKIILSLKNNNFIKWLNNSENNNPFHINKKGKRRINRKTKLSCWDKEFDTNTNICPIKNCSVELNKNENNWHAGHIISEYNGGSIDISNLRPICIKCNSAMGTKNWNDYDK